MAEKTMLNFRCPADVLDAIDSIGQERYPSESSKHGCDRSKTLLDIVRAGIEVLSGNSVLQMSNNSVRQDELISSTEGKTVSKTEESDCKTNEIDPGAKLTQYLESLKTPLCERFQEDIKTLKLEMEAIEIASHDANYLAAERLDEIGALEKKLEAIDALIVFKNNEIAECSAQLAAKNQIIAEAEEQISQLEFQLKAAAAEKSSEFPRPAQLIDLLKIERPKLKISQIDITAIYSLLNKHS
jgi:chromosome segregation ATPase